MIDFIRPFIAEMPVALQWGLIGGVIIVLFLSRYVLIAGLGFAFSQVLRVITPSRRLQPLPFTRQQVLREILHSCQSVLVFAGVIGIIIMLNMAGWTQMYRDPGALGWVWFWLQIPVVLFIQDWYFYWMHRISHRPGIYERVHKTHHLSTNPSAFAAFAFHPLEAILEIAIFIPILMVIPTTPSALLIVGVISLVYNVYGHLGYEIMPRALAKSPIGFLLNKSAYHNQHHRTYAYNFGLYTTIWDRLHGTLHPKAEAVYDKATQNHQATSSNQRPQTP